MPAHRAGFSPRPQLDKESGLSIAPPELAAGFLGSSGRDGHPGTDRGQCNPDPSTLRSTVNTIYTLAV